MTNKFIVTWIEKKNPDWSVAQLKDVDTPNLPYADVSINRTGKKGEIFPNFDGIMNGGTVEGEIWQSAKGTWYLFPPKVVATGNSGRNSAMSKLVTQKQEGITKAQENKELGIMTSSTIRMAVDCALAEYNNTPQEDIEAMILKWRKWFVDNWDLKDHA